MEKIKRLMVAMALAVSVMSLSPMYAMDNTGSGTDDGDEKYDAAAVTSNEAAAAIELPVFVDVDIKERDKRRHALNCVERRALDDGLVGAVLSNNVRRLRQLLNMGADHNTMSNTGATDYAMGLLDSNFALSLAAQLGYINIIKVLIAYGADVNRENPFTVETALYKAIVKERTEVVELLLKNGASIDKAAGEHGIPVLLTVAASGDYNTLALLLRYGAHVAVTDKQGRDALFYITMHGEGKEHDVKIKRMLVLAGVDADRKITDARCIRNSLRTARIDDSVADIVALSALDLERLKGEFVIAQAVEDKKGITDEVVLFKYVVNDQTLMPEFPASIQQLVAEYVVPACEDGTDLASFMRWQLQQPVSQSPHVKDVDEEEKVSELGQDRQEERRSWFSVGHCCSAFSNAARAVRNLVAFSNRVETLDSNYVVGLGSEKANQLTAVGRVYDRAVRQRIEVWPKSAIDVAMPEEEVKEMEQGVVLFGNVEESREGYGDDVECPACTVINRVDNRFGVHKCTVCATPVPDAQGFYTHDNGEEKAGQEESAAAVEMVESSQRIARVEEDNASVAVDSVVTMTNSSDYGHLTELQRRERVRHAWRAYNE